MKLRVLFVGLVSVCLFSLSGVQFNASSSSQPMLVIDGDIADFLAGDPIAVSGANGSSDDVPPTPAGQEDFGGDGTIIEFYAVQQGGRLFLAVRGDMFGEPDGDNNAHVVLVDIDPGMGTGAKDLDADGDGFGDDGDPSDLDDTSDIMEREAVRPRSVVTDEGSNLSPERLMQGIGWDLAVSLTAATSDSGAPVSGMFSWGSAGLPGTTTTFTTLDGDLAYDLRVSPSGPGNGNPGTVAGGRDGFEVEIPLAQLKLGPGQHQIVLVALTTPNTGYPSPNQLPESSDLSNASHGTMTIDKVATITVTIP